MAKKITFSPAAIDGLADGVLADPLTPGLAIEVLGSGKKRWRYRRKIAGKKAVATLFGGLYPAAPIADARIWARELNNQVENGLDPRATQRDAKALAEMTVAKAHALYMAAVREGRSCRRKGPAKPATIKDKLGHYRREIEPQLGAISIHDVTEEDLVKIVEAKGKTAKVNANHLGMELNCFFGWATSLMGTEVGLTKNPASRLKDLRFQENPCTRIFSTKELEWLLEALAYQPRLFQRVFLLCLLTAARLSEVTQAKSSEFSDGLWTIPAERVKNSVEHKIALGPWGRSLALTNQEWLFQSELVDGPRGNSSWYRARNQLHARMEKIAGRMIEPFTPHDFRRTARSNTKRLQVDFETAEAMLNHRKKGLERVYDLYALEDEKREWFLKWENEIRGIAERVGVASALGAPTQGNMKSYSFSISLPKGSGIQPGFNLGSPKSGTDTKLATPAPKFIFTREPGWPSLSQPIDLPSRQPGQVGEFLHRYKPSPSR